MEPRTPSYDSPEATRRREEQRRRELAAEQARRIEIQRASLAALAAIADERERETVAAIDAILGGSLGSPAGYLPVLAGCPATRRLQRVVASYGVTPDYDGVRHLVRN